MTSEPWFAGHRPTHHPKASPIAFLEGLVNQPWADEALCAQTDPDSFFPEKGGSVREAKAVCASCDVREQCLAYALEQGEPFGIWGGLSERERRRLRKNPTAPPRPCRRAGCSETIPASALPTKRYHDAACGLLARKTQVA